MVGHRIASLLKASPEGEGFHPSQTGTLSISGDYVRTIDYKIRNDRIGAKVAIFVLDTASLRIPWETVSNSAWRES
jgi:hypothetical protein